MIATQTEQANRFACRVADLKKEYVLKSETVRALRGVTFDVPEGTMLLLWGHPDLGKARCSTCWVAWISPLLAVCGWVPTTLLK